MIYQGLLNIETLEVETVYKNRGTGKPSAVRLEGLNPKYMLVDCDTFGACPNAAETVRDHQWAKVEADRSERNKQPVNSDGTLYIATAYAIEGYTDAIAEDSDLDVITDAGEKVLKTVVQLKAIMTSYRTRKKLLSDASWSVLDELQASDKPGTIDVLSRFAAKISELSQ